MTSAALALKSRRTRLEMKELVAIGIAIGVLWSADVFLNDGRYGEVIEIGMMILAGK
jgi:hypothetical protein